MRAALLIALVLGQVAFAADPPPFAKREVLRSAGFTIEFDPADTEYARALVERLPTVNRPPPEAAIPLRLEDLRTQREAILLEIAKALGAAEPSASMRTLYDGMVSAQLLLLQVSQESGPTKFSLWRKSDLVARLQAGQQLPGFELGSDGNVNIALNVSFKNEPGSTAERNAALIRRAWGQVTWPVKIGERTPVVDIEASIASLDGFRRSVSANETGLVMATLHEVVESTIVSETIRSKDRRWFCEGVANYLALQILSKRVGAEAARAYYDLDALLASAGAATMPGLVSWPVMEATEAKHTPGDINLANYALATKVIRDITATHGAELLPKIFAEIRKTPADRADIDTVYGAYRAVTGEELEARLAD